MSDMALLKAVEVALSNIIGLDHALGTARVAGLASKLRSPRLRAMIERREFKSGRTTLLLQWSPTVTRRGYKIHGKKITMSPLMLELPMTPLHLLPSAVRVRSSSTLAVTALLPSLMKK